jgi:hypothetical protein
MDKQAAVSNVKYAVFVPAGPNVVPEFLYDTIESALTFMGRDTLVIVGDDSRSDKFDGARSLGSNIHVRPVPTVAGMDMAHSTAGSLFVKKVRIYQNVVKEFEFDRLLSLDDDALMLNDRVIGVAEHLFAHRDRAGILGRYALDHQYQPVAAEAQLEQMRTMISRNPFRNPKYVSPLVQPKLRQLIRPLMLRAIENGYTMGTAFIGGSVIYTRKCLEDILSLPEIEDLRFQWCPGGEDDVYSICCYASGHRIYDLIHEPTIFHIGWRQLTLSPQELHDMGASVIHSVRDPEYGGEAKIREFFKEKRRGVGDS